MPFLLAGMPTTCAVCLLSTGVLPRPAPKYPNSHLIHATFLPSPHSSAPGERVIRARTYTPTRTGVQQFIAWVSTGHCTSPVEIALITPSKQTAIALVPQTTTPGTPWHSYLPVGKAPTQGTGQELESAPSLEDPREPLYSGTLWSTHEHRRSPRPETFWLSLSSSSSFQSRPPTLVQENPA